MPTLGSTLSTSTIREVLTANRTYYVRTDGNDSNTGLVNNSGGAFLTIQKAVDVTSTLDVSTFTVTIQVADGTYVANLVTLKNAVGSGEVVIQGNSSTPDNVVIDGGFVKSSAGTVYTVKDCLIKKNLGNAIIAIDSLNSAKIQFSNVNFNTGLSYHVRAFGGGFITATGNYKISGGATFHSISAYTGVVNVQAMTVTVTGTPAFSYFCYAARFSVQTWEGSSFSGSATGTRYLADLNSVIWCAGGATFFPGDVSGTTLTGGQYN